MKVYYNNYFIILNTMLVIKSLKVRPKKIIALVMLVSFIVTTSFNFDVNANNKQKIIYPFKEISKLKCRFEDFNDLKSDCKRALPILTPKDYKKYLKLNWGYNEYTRIYTELWASSYKYWWDIGHWGHTGIDIATAKWTPVYSIADWTVIVAKKDPSRGNIVAIKHFIRWKEIVSNYAHLSKILVKKWQKLKVGTKIGEVWSTWNSTGNHLHFQIDLKYAFHPYYYSWKTCPYSYYKITESGLCTDQLAEHTLDPLAFLASKGAILDNITISKTTSKKVYTVKKNSKKSSKNISKKTSIVVGFDMNIFEKTVHNELNSSKDDVKKVQKIYKDLGYYKGSINWRYQDVEKAIINFQLKNKIIKSKYDNWAGWFGPKTRSTTKIKYLIYLTKHKNIKVFSSQNNNTQISSTRKIIKIERKNILTRAQIEEREVNDFLRNHEVKFSTNNIGWNIKAGQKINLKLLINKKIGRRTRRAFNWMLPSGITFELDESKVSIFPKKITHITNWKRDIILKWLKSGNTTLKIKLANKVIKTIKLKVIGKVSKIYPKKVILLWSSHIKLWERKTMIWLFRDWANKNMIKLPFNWTFILKTGDYSKVCVKKGSLRNIKSIYYKKCDASEYVRNPEVSYKDTVGWILIFDIKSTSKKYSTIKMIGKNSKRTYASKTILVSLPKWLNSKYTYYNSTVDMLSKSIVWGTKKGYFMEKNNLSKKDAIAWIKNSLVEIKAKTKNSDTIAQINKKLIEINKDKDKNNYKDITRLEFLQKVHKYLVVNDNNIWISIKYTDLSDDYNKIANTVFDINNTWKDKFGKKYFRPNEKIKRWEAAYMLSKAYNKTWKMFLTFK